MLPVVQCLRTVVSCFVHFSSFLLQEVKSSPCYSFTAELSCQLIVILVLIEIFTSCLYLHVVLDIGVLYKFGKPYSSKFSCAFTNFLSTVISILIFQNFYQILNHLNRASIFLIFFYRSFLYYTLCEIYLTLSSNYSVKIQSCF